jgi:hypothetical protein
MYIYSPLENKYTKWYNNITRSAKNRGWQKTDITLKGTSPWNKGKIVGPQSQEIREKTSIAVKLWWETRRKQLINT